MEINEGEDLTVLVEGLICSACDDIFMSPQEGARFLNIQARHNKTPFYYGVHDGDIKETKLH